MGIIQPTLSICIPTYNNYDILEDVLDHALSLSNDEVEYVVGDDASSDNTADVVNSFDDNRIKYYKNENNLGYEGNLLKVIDKATGEYILPLADEDKLELSSVEWLIQRIDSSEEIAAFIGGIGRSSWEKFRCPEERLIEGGKKSVVEFASKNHGGFQNIWSRNYIGGFALKKSYLNMTRLKSYLNSYYIHNFLIYQAITRGKTLYTPRDLCRSHYFDSRDSENHRIWAGTNKCHWKFNLKRHSDRIRFIREQITSGNGKEELYEIEQRWVAQLTAWAWLSKDVDFNEFRTECIHIGHEQKSLSVYTGSLFWKYVVFYAIVYFTPFSGIISSMSNRVHSSRSARDAWWEFVFSRLVPSHLQEVTEEYYYRFSDEIYWWNLIIKGRLPEPVENKIKYLYQYIRK